MDDTTIETLSYLEARLLRIEYVLYGHTAPSAKAPAITSMHQLEHRFATLLQRVSTYKDLLKICLSHRVLGFCELRKNCLGQNVTVS